MLEVALRGRPSAAWSRAGRVPDLGQVPELDPGVMALGLEPVVALPGIDWVEPNQQILPGSRDA